MSRYRIEHIALDMAFHNQGRAQISPAAAVVEAFEGDKEHAEIFIQTATNESFSQIEILNWFLLQTRTTIADHLPPGAFATDKPVFVTFPVRFEPGTFHMQTTAGIGDISHLKLMCKVTERTSKG